MTNAVRVALLCGVFLAALPSAGFAKPPTAKPADCKALRAEYKKTHEAVRDALKPFGACVARADKAQARHLIDCAAEFGTLQSAQEDFEFAQSRADKACLKP